MQNMIKDSYFVFIINGQKDQYGVAGRDIELSNAKYFNNYEDAFEELLVMEQQTKVEDCCFYQLSSPKKFKLRLIEQIEID